MPRKPKFVTAEIVRDGPGRPSKYKAEYAGIAARLAAQGNTDREIANILGVAYSNFKRWLIIHPALKEAMVIDKKVADGEVLNSLFTLARGYDYTEEEVRVIDGKLLKIEVRKHKPGEVSACINWLSNRTEWMRNPDAVDNEPPPPEVPKEIDITEENRLQMARKVALVLYQGGKLAGGKVK